MRERERKRERERERKDILVKPNIIILKMAPMAPFKRHSRRPAIHLQHLPRKRGHHALKRLVALVEIILLRVIVLVCRDEGIVSAHAEHVLARLRGTAVEAKGVARVLDCAPVGEVGFERGFDFPVFDEVFDEVFEAACFVACCFLC